MEVVNDFSDSDKLEKLISSHLKKSNYEFVDENPNPELFNMYFTLEIKNADMKVLIGMTKHSSYKVEVVSQVQFSPDHIKVLQEDPDNIKEQMSQQIFMWLASRKGQFAIELGEDQDYENSHFLINYNTNL